MELYEKYKTLLNSYYINSPLRIAHLMAQLDHESGLKAISENLNYSATGLVKTFKKYFPNIEMAAKYSRKPELIANIVYANRMGNNDCGDGYKYRGRGFIQVTGKNNYTVLSKDTRIDFLTNPDLLLEEANALISALWYWQKNDINKFADQDNLDAISDIINLGRLTPRVGDSNGFADRKAKLIKWKSKLKIS